MNKKIYMKMAVLVIVLGITMLAGCRTTQRMGMVRDQKTGLLYGSMMNGNMLLDPSQFENPTIKLTIRNTSGDPAVNLKALRSTLERAYRDKGYEVVKGKKYSIHLDINLRYSGQISEDMAEEVAMYGAVGGAYAGARTGKNLDSTVAGAVSGATVGAIVGQYATQDTYIMFADVTIGLVDKNASKKKYIVSFGDTQVKYHDEDTGYNPYRVRETARVAVYAGGDNTEQSRIVGGVTARFRRILQDVI
ncbi:complement resistance protein TraT [Maridesulfovibrio sp.]|uniref:complement resistance protein TraT n=1 Tax=Maridesulfovibrio sp. TaxID=2795000 RepID=UPI0029C9D13F|nr:complement resistance protein TraT [Maridesulfovibrio sp.]